MKEMLGTAINEDNSIRAQHNQSTLSVLNLPNEIYGGKHFSKSVERAIYLHKRRASIFLKKNQSMPK